MKSAVRLIAVFFLTLTVAGFGLARPCAAVTLRSEAEVDRLAVRLSDVFDGLPEGIDCDIARAPAPGKSITYDTSVLTHLAQQYKLDWRPAGLGDHTTITTGSTKITADDIGAAVVAKVNALDVKGDIDVMFDNRALEINLPADRPANFTLNNFQYEATNRRFHADLVADGFAGPLTLPITGHITVRRTVPVLVRRLEAGTTIGAGDVDWLSVEDDHLAGVIMDAGQMIGYELRHDTDAGQPVRERDVMPPRLVVRGALVTMKIETPFMMVTAQGRALQDGKLGDVVRIVNTQSNRMIEGTVEAAGVVRIAAAAQKLAAADGTDKRD